MMVKAAVDRLKVRGGGTASALRPLMQDLFDAVSTESQACHEGARWGPTSRTWQSSRKQPSATVHVLSSMSNHCGGRHHHHHVPTIYGLSYI